MNAQFNGKTIAMLSKNVAGETPAKPGWTYVSYAVTATSATSTVTFAGTSAGSLGAMLDDVSLVEQPLGTASISGQVFADGNGDGKKGIDAIGLSGWKAWLDLNNNGVLDTTDLTATTDHLGNFSFINLAAGTYKVHVVAQTGWKLTTPSAVSVTLTAGQKAVNELFGEQPV
jgi:hypothetical protein